MKKFLVPSSLVSEIFLLKQLHLLVNAQSSIEVFLWATILLLIRSWLCQSTCICTRLSFRSPETTIYNRLLSMDSHDPYKMNSDSTLSSDSFFKDPLVSKLSSNLDHGRQKVRSVWAHLRSRPKKTVFWSQSFAPSPKLRPQSYSESNSQPITVFDTKSWDFHVNIHIYVFVRFYLGRTHQNLL